MERDVREVGCIWSMERSGVDVYIHVGGWVWLSNETVRRRCW